MSERWLGLMEGREWRDGVLLDEGQHSRGRGIETVTARRGRSERMEGELRRGGEKERDHDQMKGGSDKG